jgi:hypothetical protein
MMATAPLDLIGICEVQHAGARFVARKNLAFPGAELESTGRRTIVRVRSTPIPLEVSIGDSGWSWIIAGDGNYVGYEATSGDWFGSNAQAVASGFSAASRVVVSSPAPGGPTIGMSIQGFAWNPIQPRKVLFNRGPLPIYLPNGWVGPADEGSSTGAPTTLRIRTGDTPYVLEPDTGVRLIWDAFDSRWVVILGAQSAVDPDALTDEGDAVLTDESDAPLTQE